MSKRKEIRERMNVGPHRKKTYDVVLREEPEYVKALIKENRSDSQKSRFAHWVMACVVETFFSREEEGQEEENTEVEKSEREEVGRAIGRRRTSAERESEKREEGEPDTDSEGVPKAEKIWPKTWMISY